METACESPVSAVLPMNDATCETKAPCAPENAEPSTTSLTIETTRKLLGFLSFQ